MFSEALLLTYNWFRKKPRSLLDQTPPKAAFDPQRKSDAAEGGVRSAAKITVNPEAKNATYLRLIQPVY